MACEPTLVVVIAASDCSDASFGARPYSSLWRSAQVACATEQADNVSRSPLTMSRQAASEAYQHRLVAQIGRTSDAALRPQGAFAVCNHLELLVLLALWDLPMLLTVLTTSCSWTLLAREACDLSAMGALAWAEQERRRINDMWSLHIGMRMTRRAWGNEASSSPEPTL